MFMGQALAEMVVGKRLGRRFALKHTKHNYETRYTLVRHLMHF